MSKISEVISQFTDEWGADIAFESSGAPQVWTDIADVPRPYRIVVVVEPPVDPVRFDVAMLSTKELRVESVFHFDHQYDRDRALMSSGRIDLKPLISETFPFDRAVEAFARAAEGRP